MDEKTLLKVVLGIITLSTVVAQALIVRSTNYYEKAMLEEMKKQRKEAE